MVRAPHARSKKAILKLRAKFIGNSKLPFIESLFNKVEDEEFTIFLEKDSMGVSLSTPHINYFL